MKAKGPKELVSPSGRRSPLPADLPMSSDYTGPIVQTEVKFKCGHKGLTFQALSLNEVDIFLSPEQIRDETICAKCLVAHLLKISVRCGLCGRRILEHMPVALYLEADGFRSDATRVEYEGKPCVIGCPNCAPNKEFFLGVWTHGKFLSFTEIDDAVGQVMGFICASAEKMCDECLKKGICPHHREDASRKPS